MNRSWAPVGKIVAVGDSLTNDSPENWLARFGAKLDGATVIANAHGGWTTRSFFKEKFSRVAFARVPSDAAVFILLLGSNDLFEAGGGTDAAVEKAAAGVQRLAAHLLSLSPGAEIVLAAPPTVLPEKYAPSPPDPGRSIHARTPEYLRRLGRRYRRLARDKGWRFVDLYPVLGRDDYLDAAHPNAAGHRKMAEAMWQSLAG